MAVLGQLYNDPINGNQSSIGKQFNVDYWDKRSLIEAKKEMYFMPLASTKEMPKHFGKEIKIFHYMPLLDDRNINDQGIDAAGLTYENGNLYGSSRDIGLITARLPIISETGGRKNRVGFTRKEVRGKMENFGMFMEFSEDSLNFDTDSELYGHYTRELVTGATQLTEAVLQRDLLNGANTVLFTGAATNDSEISGEGKIPSVVTYEDFSRLNKILNDNRTPKQTTIIDGSRMIDTRVINGGRIAYCSSDVSQLLKTIKDPFGNPAFIGVKHYANAATIMNGEIGSIGEFRFIEVPEMLHWAGAGADATDANEGYKTTGGKYDVFPIMVVGEGSFTTIAFQTGGKTSKFRTIVKKPGIETATRDDPYGKMGFYSIQWWYGTFIMRPERIAVIKTVAPV